MPVSTICGYCYNAVTMTEDYSLQTFFTPVCGSQKQRKNNFNSCKLRGRLNFEAIRNKLTTKSIP